MDLKKYFSGGEIIHGIVILAFLLAAMAVSAFAADFDAYCYWVPSGTQRSIAWDAQPGATAYELQVRRMETGATVYQGRVARTELAIKWKTPGHYVVYLRAVNRENVFGEWTNTLDPNTSLVLVGGDWAPRAWVLIVPTTY